MADRIVIMQDGKIAQTGAPMEVYRHPANTFVATFTGSPPMNLLPARYDGGRVQLAGVELPLGLAARPGELIAGFRPEDLGLEERPGRVRLAATVVAVETLGAEAILVAAFAGGEEINVRVDAETRLAPGSAVQLFLEPERLRLFDATTTRAIERVRQPQAIA